MSNYIICTLNIWFNDVRETIKGDDDRNVIAKRVKDENGVLRIV